MALAVRVAPRKTVSSEGRPPVLLRVREDRRWWTRFFMAPTTMKA